jgi:hypothetical protein
MRPIARPQRGEDEQMPWPKDVPSTDDTPDAHPHADSRDQTAGAKNLLQHRGDRLQRGHPSSPYDEDGTVRPAAISLKELEAADETDDGVSEGWRAALPRLQGLWERHKERWPAEQRSPVDRSKDDEGAWRGDGPGQYLNAEENLVTEHALDRVHDAEREVTGTLKAIEAEVPGARLVGLEHRLKGMERFKEKVAEGLALKHERAVGKVVDAIPDALRYTCQLPADGYLDGYRTTSHQLEQHGYRQLFSRNSWESLDYKGVNTRWRAPTGGIFEVQFHTTESFEAKELTHYAYKRLRNTSTDRREMGELRQFQREVSARIQVPDRVNEIRDFRQKGG